MSELSSNYQIIQKIGEGNSGEVYLAIHKNLNKRVVLKKIKSEVRDFMDKRAEVDLLKNLRHSHLPQVLDFLQIGRDVYTVMDYIPGKSFKQYLDSGTVFEERDVIYWAKQISDTLVYLHTRRPPIIHSDLKPANIMLMPDGNICVIDFNISSSLNRTGAVVTGATKGYASPEQIQAFYHNRNQQDRTQWMCIDERSDIYSLGATLYHMLTGRKPALMENGRVDDIRRYAPHVREVTAAVVMRCLEPNPDYRYQSAAELSYELENIDTKDQRYRSLLKHQKFVYFMNIAGLICSMALSALGVMKYFSDRQKSYQDMVTKEIRSIQSGDYDAAGQYFEKAISLKADDLEPYYQKAVMLYQQHEYEQCIAFIEDEILSDEKLVYGSISFDGVYAVMGNAWENLTDVNASAGAQAEACYQKAIALNQNDAGYYRDYAIVLARNGKLPEAQAALDQATLHNLDSLQLNSVRGEILKAQKNYEEAFSLFENCAAQTSDEELKERSYLNAADCLDQLAQQNAPAGQGLSSDVTAQAERYQQEAELLKKGVAELPACYMLKEKLGDTYYRLGELTGENSWFEEAVDQYTLIKNSEYVTMQICRNLERLYRRIASRTGDSSYLQLAGETLAEMESRYADDYRTYMELAFYETELQQTFESGLRDYSDFIRYYEKAEELYKKSVGTSNRTNQEMQTLESRYAELQEAGWLQN